MAWIKLGIALIGAFAFSYLCALLQEIWRDFDPDVSEDARWRGLKGK